jgi:chaperonin GroEL (HSP60 family)
MPMMGSGSGFDGVAKQLFGDMAVLTMERVAAQGQNMHVKSFRIASIDGIPALDVFRQQDGDW